MSQFFYAHEVSRPEDVKLYLAKDYHWKKGYSAYELATSWVSANGIPEPVRTVLDRCEDYRHAKFIEGFFEREVDLRTAGRKSQTDLMALVSTSDGYAVIAVEGKVDETFGPLVAEWNDGSPGKLARISALCTALKKEAAGIESLRYQLFHRTVSALYEAQRYQCRKALTLVHSFSSIQSSFDDFAKFTAALGVPVDRPGMISQAMDCDGISLRFGWCADVRSE